MDIKGSGRGLIIRWRTKKNTRNAVRDKEEGPPKQKSYTLNS
jgi:hypothetical protein